jgi:hypothetical protein
MRRCDMGGGREVMNPAHAWCVAESWRDGDGWGLGPRWAEVGCDVSPGPELVLLEDRNNILAFGSCIPDMWVRGVALRNMEWWDISRSAPQLVWEQKNKED